MQPTPLPLLTPRKRPTPTPPHLTPYPPKKLDTLLHTPYTSPMPNKKQDKRAQAKARAKIRRATDLAATPLSQIQQKLEEEGTITRMDATKSVNLAAANKSFVKRLNDMRPEAPTKMVGCDPSHAPVSAEEVQDAIEEFNHEEDLKELGQRTESANAFLNRNEVPPADILSRNQAIGLLAVAFIVVVIIAALYA